IKVADLLTEVLQAGAKLLDCPDPGLQEVQTVGMGGIPIPRRGERWLETREHFKRDVTRLTTVNLEARQQDYPAGVDVIWASILETLPNHYTRIPAVRVFPIPGTARDYIERMLATDETPPPLHALPAPRGLDETVAREGHPSPRVRRRCR
ncbi:MAG: hypothetical protein ACRDS0_40845, partial [Pseudonocardiaceae bacterium]